MRFVSPLLKRIVYPSLATAGYYRRRRLGGDLCVVSYHGVFPDGYESRDSTLDGNLVSPVMLRSQLQLLKSHYNVVSADDVLAWLETNATLPPRSVLLTCDDGLVNVLTDMLPVLHSEGVPCLFFVTGASAGELPRMLWYEELYLLLMAARTREIGLSAMNLYARLESPAQRRALWWKWVKELSRYDTETRETVLGLVREQGGLLQSWRSEYEAGSSRRRFFMLTAVELRQLARAGMSVGAHTMGHPLLAQAPSEEVWMEIVESREAISGILGQPVRAMAYPFGNPGSAGPREFEMAERAGYSCAFLNFGGGFGADLPRFAIPRVHVTANMSLGEFEAHVSGLHGRLQRLFGRQGASCA